MPPVVGVRFAIEEDRKLAVHFLLYWLDNHYSFTKYYFALDPPNFIFS